VYIGGVPYARTAVGSSAREVMGRCCVMFAMGIKLGYGTTLPLLVATARAAAHVRDVLCFCFRTLIPFFGLRNDALVLGVFGLGPVSWVVGEILMVCLSTLPFLGSMPRLRENTERGGLLSFCLRRIRLMDSDMP
jgi:hypothetical protein